MTSIDSNSAPLLTGAEGSSVAGRLWTQHGRMTWTLIDQGLVSLASFVTNFLLLRHFAHDATHYAYYTLAFNLLIWVGELHATLVFTPHTILSPLRNGAALRRFHGSTLLHQFGVSILAMVALLIAAAFQQSRDAEMAKVLLVLALGTIAIGLRNYARPYAFTARNPQHAVLLDVCVCTMQVGGVIALGQFGYLNAWTAIAALAVASAVPSVVWLAVSRRHFTPSLAHAVSDFKAEWPGTRWMLFSGLVWNAGMSLYPWLISAARGTLDVAIWGACYTLAAVANPLLMGLQNFTGPRIAEAYAERDTNDFVRFVYRTAAWTSALMIGPAIALSIFANYALAWLTRGQFDAHQVAIAFLCGAIVLQSLTFTLSRGLFALRRADLDLYCNFGPLILLFTGGWMLTSSYGVTGAAASMLIAQVLSCLSRGILFRYAANKLKVVR
ncbi:MAG TPA: hypothetical protein VGB55_11785 [Tepidisphaeraceae bacterium]|jgi:O-antigen/teichoic acid export membrane protein